MKKYYIATPENYDRVYGGENPVCLSLNAVKRLSREWDISTPDLLKQMTEASAEQIAEYGTSDD